MISQANTRTFDTAYMPVATGFIFEDEGMAAVYAREGDNTVVTASTGVSGEVFAGITQSRNIPPQFNNAVIEGVVPASGKIELPRTPLTGGLLVKVAGAKKTIGASAPASAAAVQLDGNDVIFHADAEGEKYFIVLQYELTVTEARTLVGDAPVGGLSSSAQGVIGLYKRGYVGTSYFVATDDWAGAIKVKLGAGGFFTLAGNGTELTNAVVKQSPSAGNPVLVLDLSL